MPVAPASPIGVEILDDPDADAIVVHRMLGDIARANRWFGGTRAVRVGLRYLLTDPTPGRRVTLLDIGAGAGDLARDAVRWGAARGIGIAPIALERHRVAARLAGAHGGHAVVGCATALPWPAASVDIVLLSQVVHHFPDATATTMLAQASAVARLGVIVADLRPSRVAAPAFVVAGTVLGLARDTIRDGVTSLARGRDANALGTLARNAGAREIAAWSRPFARVTIAWRTAR